MTEWSRGRVMVTGGGGFLGKVVVSRLGEAEGIVLAAERYDGSEPVNLGTGQKITIRELVELIVATTGFRGAVNWDPRQPDGQPRRALETSRASEGFRFEANLSLEEGLWRTIGEFGSTRTESDDAPIGAQP